MTSHNRHQNYNQATAEHNGHRIIPGRMANYHNPVPQTSGPYYSSHTSQPVDGRPNRSYLSNYLETTPDITTSDRTNLCPQHDTHGSGKEDFLVLETAAESVAPSIFTRLLAKAKKRETEPTTFQ
jgi:hypothetical protein